MSEDFLGSLKVSPYWELLGMKIVCQEEGFARLEMPVKNELKQAYGVVHGGAIASLIDSSIAVAIISGLAPGESATTVEIKVNYLAPVVEGKLFAEAKIARKGRTIVVGIIEVTDATGALVAIGTSTYMILRPSNAVKPEQLG
ncbi:MAG TPA: PaaI family thioesterase [Candidatus Limnocylindrales bacterium]|nr:PaaI family thioesterase [Candidatus Limnocylindrales bacterium]